MLSMFPATAMCSTYLQEQSVFPHTKTVKTYVAELTKIGLIQVAGGGLESVLAIDQ